MAEGFEPYHVPQQSRRDKLRVLPPTQHQQHNLLLEPSSSSVLPLYEPSSLTGYVIKQERPNLMSSSNTSSILVDHPESSSLSMLSSFQLNGNTNNPFFYLQGYNSNNSANNVLKPEPLALTLSSNSRDGNCPNHLPFGSLIEGFSSGSVGGGGGGTLVLKGSRFLKPANELLEEICDVGGGGGDGDGGGIEKIVFDATLMEPPPLPQRENEEEDLLADHGHKKSRLVTMLDEVYRRYRQYYQQMHAVITSFEYVSGLSNAAPYASLAIKTMSKHFRFLKSAITDQLQFANKAHFHMSHLKDASPRFGNSDRVPYSQRPGFHDNQPVWRPQRGLPERAVAVLRAWLFEHFLHPYPTDTDKLMLAKQTGLSRSQVSNWFINARVRLWKPMVEEIHMLETQQGQNNSQKEEHCRNKSSDHLPSANSLVSDNPSTSTDKFLDAPYKRVMNEFPNIPVRSQEQLNLPCTGNQPVGVSVNMGNSSNNNNNNVSLTLGLYQNHGIGLAEPFPLSAVQRFGLALENSNEGYVMSGFESQNRHFARDVIGGQLLHDFVG